MGYLSELLCFFLLAGDQQDHCCCHHGNTSEGEYEGTDTTGGGKGEAFFVNNFLYFYTLLSS